MQDELKDCGAACLLTLIKTYGGSVSMEYLRLLTNTSNNGTNFSYMMDAANVIGFNSKAVKGDVDDIQKKYLPCIAHVVIDSKFNHFVVIQSITSNYVLISDPASGLKKVKKEEFKKICTNQFLFLIPNKKLLNIKSKNVISDYLYKFITSNKKYFISITVYSLVYTLLNIISSYGFQIIIEDSIEKSSINNLYFILIFLLVFAFLKNLMDYFRTIIHAYIMNNFDFLITTNTFKHIILLPYQYFKNKSTSDVFSRMSELNNIKDSLSNIILYILSDSILFVFVFICLLFINVYLTFISSLIIFLYFLIIKIFDGFLQKKFYEIKKETAIVNNNLIESLESVDMIKGLRLEREFFNNFVSKYNKFLSVVYDYVHFSSFENFFKNIINDFGILLIFLFGSILVINNRITINDLITFNALIIFFLEPLKNIIDSNIQYKKMIVSIRRINDLYLIDEEKLELDKKYVGKKLEGNILIKDLCYSYNGRDNILNNIDLNIKTGERVIIFGNSGSGKSTLVKIINRYYKQDSGYIKIGDKEIDDFNLLEIRRDICYVSQNEKILTDSVYNNIVLGRNIDYDYFIKICKLTQIDSIIKNNILKYDMLLEENGFNISGGERQKIIMARSLLKESNIYIFDESLSQVDIESERKIIEKIFKFLKGKIVIFISHRYDNNDLFDKQFFIQNGVLYEK